MVPDLPTIVVLCVCIRCECAGFGCLFGSLGLGGVFGVGRFRKMQLGKVGVKKVDDRVLIVMRMLKIKKIEFY